LRGRRRGMLLADCVGALEDWLNETEAEPEPKRPRSQPHDEPTREPTREPTAAALTPCRYGGAGIHSMELANPGVNACESHTPTSGIAPIDRVAHPQGYQKASHPRPSPQLPIMPGAPLQTQLPAPWNNPQPAMETCNGNLQWNNPRSSTPGMASYRTALAAPVHAVGGFLPLPVQAVECLQPSWPVVAQPQPMMQPVLGWMMQQDNVLNEKRKQVHNQLNRKRTSCINHLIEELAKRVPMPAHPTADGSKRSKLDILNDVLAFVEASHVWFAEAGVELPLPSDDESMLHSLKGVGTSVVRRQRPHASTSPAALQGTGTREGAPAGRMTVSPRQTRLGPGPTEMKTQLGSALTEGSVASDDTESFRGWEDVESAISDFR